MRSKLRNILFLIRRFSFWFSLLALLIIMYDFGFGNQTGLPVFIRSFFVAVLWIALPAMISRYFYRNDRPKIRVWFFDAGLLVFLLVIIAINSGQVTQQHKLTELLHGVEWLKAAVFIVFLREVSTLRGHLAGRYLNPAQLFIASFLLIIVVGTLLLLMPNASYTGISFIDALFTSASAVCVTGLVVNDTGTFFTPFGQYIILFLIQTGGIGIMTFTSYFSYFFLGSSSYENQLVMRDMTNAEKIAEVFSTLKKIIFITFIIELAGAAVIFPTLDKSLFESRSEALFFSVFHAVSAFCNAGFSTLSNSLYDVDFKYNYPLHLSVAALLIIGGLGFPIVFNFLKYLRHLMINRIFVSGARKAVHVPWVININTRIVMITTIALIAGGTILFYLFEYNNTLAEHDTGGKIVTAFFGAVTPRTAGFNTIHTASLNVSTIMIVIFLMWIGASPGSTGGGIKTSTFAVGVLNFISIARGKNRTELFRRKIANRSIRRAFAVVSLSFIVIAFAVFGVTFFDPGEDLIAVVFECFSAYSTVGLSMGITAELSNSSKIILILTMFVGRVSMLSILTAFLRNVKHLNYSYPTEEILIN